MRGAAAALQVSEFCCAALQACRFLKDASTSKEEQRAPGLITMLVVLSINLWIEQFNTLYGGVKRLWRSAVWLSLNLELICLTVIGSLLILVRSLFILEEVLNLPSCIFLIASTTGLESARMSI